MKIDIEKLAVECGAISLREHGFKLDAIQFNHDQLQAFAEAVAKELKAENEALKAENQKILFELSELSGSE